MGWFEALSWIKDLELKNVVIEMDVKLVVDAFNAGLVTSSVFGDIIDACKKKFRSYPFCKIDWVVRDSNYMAHHLAKIAMNFSSPFIWNELPFDVDCLSHTSCSC
ncbi:hypothetical protein ACS0TY_012394 [Phlomoides rotata]